MASVLLLAEEETARRYADKLEPMQLRVESARPLQIRQIPEAVQQLAGDLNSSRFAGLIVTSARAAAAVKKAVDQLKARVPEIVYAVGVSSAKSLPEVARSRCVGFEAGNANALANLIMAEAPGPLLFPCGNLASDTLPRKLEEVGCSVKCLTVYTTGPNPDLSDDLLRLQQTCGIPPTVVFFSPSGVEYSIPILKTLGFDFDCAKLLAIGPSTEEQIKKFGLKCWATACEPTPQGVATLFENKS
ncbi:uroporphyrinogen III synthase 1 [Arctopsyche grandis]|uniref:uroporphyrinogen III synthase 1 n=1 Tax=Arctopsyche grandis TaxID=121162 RepID=UPI00406D9916